jgi:hypothetical protein
MMAQYVTHHFRVGSGVDLPTRVTVAESMRPNYLCRHPNLLRIVANMVPEGGAREWFIRHHRSQENSPFVIGVGTFPAEVGGN